MEPFFISLLVREYFVKIIKMKTIRKQKLNDRKER